MWISGWYVNGGGPTNLVAQLQRVRWNTSKDRTYKVFLALGTIIEDDERMRENEEMREFERMRESGSEEKKEEREVFVERKKGGIMENMKRWGRWKE